MSYKELLATAEKQNIPIIAFFELTYRCHLKCVFCYVENRSNPAVKNERPEMNLQEYKSLLDQLAEVGTLTIVLTGGEIMVKKEWLDIAKYAREKDFNLVLFTSGTLINEKIADEIARLNPSDVEMSLHGANAKTNDGIMGVPGAFKKIIRAAKMLRKRNVSVRLKTVITKKNYLQVSAMKQLCSSLDLKYQHSPVINARADFSREPIGERLNKEQLSTYYDCFLASASCDELSLLQAPKPKRTKVFPCSVGTTIFAVNPFAEMTFCIPLNKKIGDLREQSFKEIWQNSPQVLELRKLKQENIFECVNCRVSNSCMRCQGSNFSETGSITGISTQFCDLARTEKRAIQKFIAMKRTKKQATQTNLNTKQTV